MFSVVEITDFDLKKAEKAELVTQLKEQFGVIKADEEEKKSELETNKKILMEHREKLKAMIETCKALHEGFDEKRKEVRAEKTKKIRELTDPDHAWGGGNDSWGAADSFSNPVSPVSAPAPVAAASFDEDPFKDAQFGESQASQASQPAPDSGETEARPAPATATDLSEYVKYQALYDYEARNEDELSFSTADIIMVHPGQDHEPGWLGGELNGKVGWFPEAYAERFVEGAGTDNTLQPIAEVAENGSDSSSFQDVSSEQVQPGQAQEEAQPPPPAEPLNEKFVSVFPYNSEEEGDLIFEAGEVRTVSPLSQDFSHGNISS